MIRTINTHAELRKFVVDERRTLQAYDIDQQIHPHDLDFPGVPPNRSFFYLRPHHETNPPVLVDMDLVINFAESFLIQGADRR